MPCSYSRGAIRWNCGYHVLAYHLSSEPLSNIEWTPTSVRKEMLRCLYEKWNFWKNVFKREDGTTREVHAMARSINWEQEYGLVPRKYWFITPQCAIVAATTFERPIVILTDKGEAMTFLPYCSPNIRHTEMCMLFVHGSHLKLGVLRKDAPLPPIDPHWSQHAEKDVIRLWTCTLEDRISKWKWLK